MILGTNCLLYQLIGKKRREKPWNHKSMTVQGAQCTPANVSSQWKEIYPYKTYQQWLVDAGQGMGGWWVMSQEVGNDKRRCIREQGETVRFMERLLCVRNIGMLSHLFHTGLWGGSRVPKQCPLEWLIWLTNPKVGIWISGSCGKMETTGGQDGMEPEPELEPGCSSRSHTSSVVHQCPSPSSMTAALGLLPVSFCLAPMHLWVVHFTNSPLLLMSNQSSGQSSTCPRLPNWKWGS